MKLTIEHLAPYLPYELKILNGWGDIKTLKYTHLDDEGNGFIGHVKPILRPLSDLTKEIEHNGEKFTPYYWFGMRGINIESVKDERWHIVQRLISWHFDIHKLIDANLAIDINTLKS